MIDCECRVNRKTDGSKAIRTTFVYPYGKYANDCSLIYRNDTMAGGQFSANTEITIHAR